MVWDAKSMRCVKLWTAFRGPGCGVMAMDMTPDGKSIVALGIDTAGTDAGGPVQSLRVWDWASEAFQGRPVHQGNLPHGSWQRWVAFHRSDPGQLMTVGPRETLFHLPSAGTDSLSSPPSSSQTESVEIQTIAPLHDNSHFDPDQVAMTVGCFLAAKPVSDHRDTLPALALTATSTGSVIVWSNRSLRNLTMPLQPVGLKSAINSFRIHRGAINVLTTLGRDQIVSAGEDQTIKIHDHQFRCLFSLDRSRCGPIVQVAFERSTGWEELGAAFSGSIAVLTSGSKLWMVRGPLQGKPKLECRMQAYPGQVQCLDWHPQLPVLVFGGTATVLQIWSGDSKQLLWSLDCRGTVSKLQFSKSGDFLAVGLTLGGLQIWSSQRVIDTEPTCLFESVERLHTITALVCHPREACVALGDTQGKLAVYRMDEIGRWTILGRFVAHHQSIIGLVFEESQRYLYSFSKDRHCAVYDLAGSSLSTGLVLVRRQVIEETARPLSASLIPDDQPVDRPSPKAPNLLMSNDQGQFRLLDLTSLAIRRTLRAPQSERSVRAWRLVHSGRGPLLVYRTCGQVLGMIRMPMDGNPFRSMAILAHPGGVADMAVDPSGRFAVTTGRRDAAVHVWRVDDDVLDRQIVSAGQGLQPFLSQLAGGPDGKLYRFMEDIFYYAQLISQGEETGERRQFQHHAPIAQVPNLMRALGYFLSPKDETILMEEIRRDQAREPDRFAADRIAFEDFCRLYLNHRTKYRGVDSIDPEQVRSAVQHLQSLTVSETMRVKTQTPADASHVDWTRLSAGLKSVLGEAQDWSPAQLQTLLESMLVQK